MGVPPESYGQAKREPLKPIGEVRIGRVKAAIWQNVVQTDRGGAFDHNRVSIGRTCAHRDGRCRGYATDGKDGLPVLARVAGAARC